jgi:phosphoribosylaminoimidazolecarboxamide formyltransferase/IMP cyclohydrolase
MSSNEHKTLHRALISAYHKEGLEETLELLCQHGVEILSTGGTASWIREKGFEVTDVESLTGFPAILGGRVKTLHPAIFGGILARRQDPTDIETLHRMDIPWIDLVIVDLYPFEKTVKTGGSLQDIIEKIDIGGVALIRAAAKNFEDVAVVPSRGDYAYLNGILRQRNYTLRHERMQLALRAFAVTSAYDAAIYDWLCKELGEGLPLNYSVAHPHPLRYGENPHQKGWFSGELNEVFEILSGKELSYNNLLDLESGFNFLEEFHDPTWVIIKHNNPCGLATASTPEEAFEKALRADEKSAFGGVFMTNRPVTLPIARRLKDFFYEVLSAPDYDAEALTWLKSRPQRIVLKHSGVARSGLVIRSALNGFLIQERDQVPIREEHWKCVTEKRPDDATLQDLKFAWKVVRHVRSNAIVIARDRQILGVGAGHTSRIDALEHALKKANEAGLSVHDAVIASEAFFPFADSVEKAAAAGIKAIIQPGGSVRDQDSIDACNHHGIAMVFTGVRHFKH